MKHRMQISWPYMLSLWLISFFASNLWPFMTFSRMDTKFASQSWFTTTVYTLYHVWTFAFFKTTENMANLQLVHITSHTCSFPIIIQRKSLILKKERSIGSIEENYQLIMPSKANQLLVRIHYKEDVDGMTNSNNI